MKEERHGNGERQNERREVDKNRERRGEACRGREPIHHNNPDRPLIQLTDRRHRGSRDDPSLSAAVGCGPLNIMKVCEMHASGLVTSAEGKTLTGSHFTCAGDGVN